MELWNDKFLARPPNNAVKTRIKREDLLRLRCTLKHALNILESKKYLDQEAAMLSRIIFRLKRRMRQHASSLFYAKVYRGLKRFFLLDFKEVVYNFEQSLVYALDDADVSNLKSIELYLPTRQFLEYVLIRTQTFAKLMQYLATACENAAIHVRAHLTIGHLLRDYTIGFCVVSRIWYFSSYFVSCACSWYKELLGFRHIMKPLGVNWLPHNYKFPVDLSIWVGRNALTGKFWSSNIDVEVGSAGPSIEKPSSVDLGEIVTRSEYDDFCVLEKTDEHTNPQSPKKRKRGNDYETNRKGKQKKKKKKIQVETENDTKNIEERDLHKLQEENEINTEEVIPRGEYDASCVLQKTDEHTNLQGSWKRGNDDETNHKGKQKKKKKKIKVETVNDEENVEERDLHKLSEDTEINTKVNISRGEYDGSSFLHKTDTHTNPQGSIKSKKKRENYDKTYHIGKRKKKIKVETENDETNVEERDFHKLLEDTEMNTKVKLATPSVLNLSPLLATVKSESEKSIAKKKKLRGKEEVIASKKKKSASIAVSMVIGHRFKKKTKKISNRAQ